ncbi:ATP-binding cassette domain-containing protein, partial [Nocardia farcinica]|uniref:ATP-binding cassette domain-containing protein n=1 Tax=Nocardia farcinica TaxID=37329 RepID=UPI003CC803B4
MHEIDLRIERGEILGVIGYSGAGKSTLARLINGLEKPTAGTIEVAGPPQTPRAAGRGGGEPPRHGGKEKQMNQLPTAPVTPHISAHLRACGVVDTGERLSHPAFADFAARLGAGEGCIDVEHLLSWCIGAALQRAFPPSAGPGALLACT